MNLISFKNLYFSSLLYYYLLSLQLASVHAANFNLTNNCSYTVWAAAVPGGGRELKHGQEWVFNTDPNFADRGQIWARTNCKFDKNGNGKCENGDCNGAELCVSEGTRPYTLAEYSFERNQINNLDFFDISVASGFNVPMEFRGTSSDCSKVIKCVGDINGFCPTELRHSGGCYHPCTIFKNNQFCCLGVIPRCDPSEAYFKFFKDLCPNAYSYTLDDVTSTLTCPTGTDYKVVFCPSST
ncbi:hypothetical protein LWI29_036930 [Acer saccharum]|uniref:Thaumatin-like protein n=1 Tax=Acer saccharum TaxID=4024 RepID=A0AA39VJA0_ACESA|nr:hypothetical protein LWI29_036930 [Acer saccharum]